MQYSVNFLNLKRFFLRKVFVCFEFTAELTFGKVFNNALQLSFVCHANRFYKAEIAIRQGNC